MQIRHALLGSILFLAMAAFAQDSVQTGVNAGVFSGSAHFGAAPPAQRSQAVAGAPYSAEEIGTTVQTLADGTRITRENSTRKLYRDSAGRTRTERPLLGAVARRQKAEAPVIIEIIDPVEHVKYTLDSVNKVAHKQAMAAREGEHAAVKTAPEMVVTMSGAGSSAAAGVGSAAPAQEAGEDAPKNTREKLEDQTMEGLLVKGTRLTKVYPTGSEGNDRPFTVVHETWRSPELKVIVLSTDNDPRFGETTRKLTNINRSDPDPSLFLPPADYSVVEEKGEFTIKWGSEK
jgi:hypothetical protein